MMVDKKRKVPNLRFKGFTNDWVQRNLADLSDGFSYGLNAAAKEYDGVHGYLRITDIDEVSHSFLPEGLTSPDVPEDQLTDYRMDEQSIVYARTGASTGKTYIYRDSDGELYYAGFLIRQKVNKETSAQFVYQNTLTKAWERYVQVMSQRSGQPGINAQEVGRFELAIPERAEQDKIAHLFNSLDNLIAANQRKLDLLKEQKKGYLQKMFPKNGAKVPELRFAGFADAWEQRKLGDLIKEFSIKSKIEDEYKVLSSTNSGMKFREGRVTGTSNLGYKIIKNGDLVLSPQNLWLGNININNIGKGLVSPSYKTFKLINIDSSFINPQLRTQKMLEEYKNSSTQGASVVRRNLEIDSFYQIKIFVPTISEQEKIGSFFQQLDNTIVLQHQKLAKYQSVKKSLLQQMFI